MGDMDLSCCCVFHLAAKPNKHSQEEDRTAEAPGIVFTNGKRTLMWVLNIDHCEEDVASLLFLCWILYKSMQVIYKNHTDV